MNIMKDFHENFFQIPPCSIRISELVKEFNSPGFFIIFEFRMKIKY